MLGRVYSRARWYLLPLIMLATGIIVASSSVFAGVPPTDPTGNGAGVSQHVAYGPASGFTAQRLAAAPGNPNTNGNGNGHRILPPRTADAFLTFVPAAGAPPNGGTVNVGDRFILELWLNAGTNVPPVGSTAQQSYLTYTYQLLQNARVSAITSTCTVTNTVTGDLEVFDATLQNEVCNGPGQCVFRGVAVGPGSFAYASGALSNCPDGCGGFFRVAQTGWCAMAPGRGLIHWQFTPPAPLIRDTEIVALDGGLIHNHDLFTDYVINISGGGTNTPTPQRTATRTNTPSGGSPTPTPGGDAFLVLVPNTTTLGLCPAPSNGGSTNVGCTFALDLMLNTGSRNDATAQQSYLTFTYQLIQNARVSSIGTSCVPTNTVTTDLTVFDAALQNEVCNGPGQCVFRGVAVGPGSFAYASGALVNCPEGCGGYFRVGTVGICATNGGAARLHWQFTPPDPMIRDTEIVAFNGDLIQNRALFADYVINITGGGTPTPPPPTTCPTTAPTNTFTPTFTQPPRTNTPTLTPSRTNTPPQGFTFTPTRTNTPSGGSPTPTPGGDAFLVLVPNTTTLGLCPAPSNGGSTNVGCTFALDLMLNTGSRNDATAQQSYLTFTYQLIQNARVSSIGTSCVPTNTITPDLTIFDAALQNEVCNGPGQCVFRGVAVGPGSFAYASGALVNCPEGCGGYFRVGTVGICATAAGRALMHWQFTPPDPMIRDTEIVAFNGDLIQNRALFADYVINITGGGTPTLTPAVTSTRTNTPCPTGTPGLVDVMIMDFSFQPQVMNIQAGTYVRWTNHDTAPHTATSDSPGWDSGILMQNQQYQFIFLTPGTFTYHCTVHPNMTGTINVAPRPPCGTPGTTVTTTPTRTNTPSGGSATPTPGQDAFLVLVPGAPGNCVAPPNGGSTNVGCRFVLDLMLNTGSRNDATAQQSYMTFTYQLIQNARVDQIATACVPTSTVAADLTTFDAQLQNEVCNGPGQCVFRGVAVDPGSLAFASGALVNCPTGCGGVFRVAQVGICAVAGGRALIHWQFTPPAPLIRDTEIVAFNGDLIQNPALFTDYVINITGGGTPTLTPIVTITPTRTNTPTNTPIRTITPTNTAISTATFTNTPIRTSTFTNTPVPTSVATNTNTPIRTNTPVRTDTPQPSVTPCGECNLELLVVTSSCNIDGTVHWIAVAHNPDPCMVSAPWRAELQVRNNNGAFRTVRIQYAISNFPSGDTILDGVFCYHFSSNVRDVRVEYLFEDQAGRSRSQGSNATIQERAAPPNSYSTTPDSGIPATHGTRTSPSVCDADMASHPMPPCEQTETCGMPPTPLPTGVPTRVPALLPSR